MLAAYPRPLSVEMYGEPVPISVNAAAINDSDLYLLSGRDMFHYTFNGSVPDMVYNFEEQFDMTANSEVNPFSALLGSHLTTAPDQLTAMVYKGDGTVLYAFSAKKFYSFVPANGHWNYEGNISTPCG